MALRKPKAERRAEILDAAIALADAEGLAALTLRAVGQRVGVTAMALYGYFPDKDSLLDAMADRVIGDVPESLSALAGWRDRLLAGAEVARVMAREHPSLVQYGFTRPAETPRTLRVVEFIYRALLDAGVPHAEIPRLERLYSTFVMGWALSEASGRLAASRMSRRERRDLLGPDEMPAYDEVAAVRDTRADPDAEFLADLTGILDLIEAAARDVRPALQPLAQPRKNKDDNHGTLSRAPPGTVHLPGNQPAETCSTTAKHAAHGVQVHAIPTGGWAHSWGRARAKRHKPAREPVVLWAAV